MKLGDIYKVVKEVYYLNGSTSRDIPKDTLVIIVSDTDSDADHSAVVLDSPTDIYIRSEITPACIDNRLVEEGYLELIGNYYGSNQLSDIEQIAILEKEYSGDRVDFKEEEDSITYLVRGRGFQRRSEKKAVKDVLIYLMVESIKRKVNIFDLLKEG